MRRELLVSFLLVAAVVAAYWPVHSYPPVLLDDQGYVFENPFVRNGLTAEGVAHAFCGATASNWHPLTMLSHMLDCQLFGGKEENAGWHHMVNLAFHAVNTVLLFLALRRMTGAVWRSALVAALFGLHPLHVESVAWIAERKDVLSTFFFMLILLAYQRYARRPTLLGYSGVFVLLACGLMSKPMLVTVPFVLLLLDYWPLVRMRLPQVEAARAEMPAAEDEEDEGEDEEADNGRNDDSTEDDEEVAETGEDDADDQEIEEDDGDEDDDRTDDDAESEAAQGPADESAKQPLRVLIVEKIPMLILAALSSALTFAIQQRSGAMGMLEEPSPLWTRIGNAIFAYGRYLEKGVWPSPLAVIYPYVNRRLVDVLVVGIALGAITAAAFLLARIRPFLVVGWCWYLGTLVPVIGLVQVGSQAMADRYTYIPLIGIFIIAVWGIAEVIDEWPDWAKVLVAAAVLAACGFLTRQQVTHWSSNEALHRHAAEAEPYNFVAQHGLGMAYWKAGDLDKAHKQFADALKTMSDAKTQIHGGQEPFHRALGLLLAVQNKPAEALAELDEAMKVRPQQPEPPRHKAWILATSLNSGVRDGKKAVELAKLALELAPMEKPAEYWDTLAAAQAEAGQYKEAVASEEAALEKARAAQANELIPGIQYRLERFKSGRPYHAKAQHPKF
jgi:protein O-mannosyl-transferase